MTTTGRLPDQPQQHQTATEHRPVGDRSPSAVARIQGARFAFAIVDEPFQLDGQTIYSATNPDSGNEAHRIALARLAQPLERLTAIWVDIVETIRPVVEALEQMPNWTPSTAPGERVLSVEERARARALWLRQHRNTGPTQSRHARRSSW